MPSDQRTEVPTNLPPELANHPRYRILRELGRGGMGVVYLARQTLMNRQVVIKVISKALLDHPDSVERFRREVQAAARLSHPNIVAAYDAEQVGELHMLVMEFVPGQSLAEILRRKGPLSVVHACHFTRQAALGLQHAHEQGMVHRDIKPQNLVMTPKGQVKVLDFGLAKLVSEHGQSKGLTSSGAYVGTPDYCAPEQASDARKADIRADIYSLGCTLYCLLAGHPPFQEETAVQTIFAHLEKEPLPLPALRPNVPADLWQVVARMLAKDPARRYQTPAEVAQALAPFCKRGGKAGPVPPTQARAPEVPPPGQTEAAPRQGTVWAGVGAGAERKRGGRPRGTGFGIPGCLGLLIVAGVLIGLGVGGIALLHPPASLVDSHRTTEAQPLLIDPDPVIALGFHDRPQDVLLGGGGVKPEAGAPPAKTVEAVWEPSMRFGLVVIKEPDPGNPQQRKRLTFDEQGLTNNTCVRLDGKEWLFGEHPWRLKSTGADVGGSWPGRWDQQDSTSLGLDPSGRQRLGHRSIWAYDDQHVFVTQTVELVPGAQSRSLDTCLVRYQLDNKDSRPHKVGIRFLLDTYIGANDGVPFTIPGQAQRCDTLAEFSRPEDVPDFVQALEHEDLAHPGAVAHLQLRLGGKLDPPDRVTLGAWPNPRLAAQDPRCRQEKTLWHVPVLSMKALSPPDSAVTIYWSDRDLAAGASREVGFAYGLGLVASGESGGRLGVTAGGSFLPGGEFTLTAYASSPQQGQTVTLTLPEGFELRSGEAAQPVPPLPPGSAGANGLVSWKVMAPATEGEYTLAVKSSTGISQTQPIRIRTNRLLD